MDYSGKIFLGHVSFCRFRNKIERTEMVILGQYYRWH